MSADVVGSYRILDVISAGGMGTVYRAEHTLIGKIAAVKILHPELSSNRDVVNRFFNEARATTAIKHPGIVEVFDFGYMASGHAYLVMEFLDGMPLSNRSRQRGAMPETEAALLLRGVCVALAAAHDKGVVHRDLKPDNIFVVPDPEAASGERTKILDFGIAKLTDLGLAGGATRTGAVMGTPAYMSPEQCRGTGEVDARADLYSVGCIFYELVTGRPVFTHAGAGELIAAHLFLAPEPPSRLIRGLSPDTEALIMALLAKRPEDRIQTARELAQRLTAIAQRTGWITGGDGVRPTGAAGAPYPGAYPGAPQLTPAPVTPAPAVTPVPPGLLAPLPPMSPATSGLAATTLSGAARQVASPRRSRTPIGIAIGIAVAAVVLGGVGAVAMFGRGSSAPAGDATERAAAGPLAPPAPPAAPPSTTAPASPPVAPPTTAPPAPDTAQPGSAAAPAMAEAAGSAVPPAQPAAEQPAPAQPASSAGSEPSPTATAAKPASLEADPPAPATRPGAADARPTKPASGKPARPKRPRPTEQQPKDLLEQDI